VEAPRPIAEQLASHRWPWARSSATSSSSPRARRVLRIRHARIARSRRRVRRSGIRAFAAVDSALAALDLNAGVKVVADWLVLQL
jgi:hypothetical protein